MSATGRSAAQQWSRCVKSRNVGVSWQPLVMPCSERPAHRLTLIHETAIKVCTPRAHRCSQRNTLTASVMPRSDQTCKNIVTRWSLQLLQCCRAAVKGVGADEQDPFRGLCVQRQGVRQDSVCTWRLMQDVKCATGGRKARGSFVKSDLGNKLQTL